MAARLASFSLGFRPVSASLNRSALPYTCYVVQRLFSSSAERRKGDKYSLKQRRRAQKFRPAKIQDEMVVPHKLETFKLDPLEDEIGPSSTVSSARRDALAATLLQAMTSLLESNDVDQELANCDFEITNVKITHDLGHAVFYWISNNKDEAHLQYVTELLQTNESSLRLLLPSYHHIHVSPRVVFSHDKHVDYFANITALLDKTTQESQNNQNSTTQGTQGKLNTST